MAVAYENPPALGEPLGRYSHLSRAGDLVIVAGQVGVRADGSLVGEDLRSQMSQIFDNLRLALEWTGGGLENVMKLTTYVVGEARIAEFREVREDLYPELYPSGKYPPNTLVVVSGLVRPGLLLEIDAIAHVQSGVSAQPA